MRIPSTLSLSAQVLGNLSNNDGDGQKNVTQEVNSHCLKLYRVYSISFIREMLKNFTGVEFQRTVSKYKKRKRKWLPVLCSRSLQNVKLGTLTSQSCNDGQGNVQKSVMHVQGCCLAYQSYLMEDVNKGRRTFLSLSQLKKRAPRKQLQGNSPTFDIFSELE